MIWWVDQRVTGPINAMRISAKNLLLAQGVGKEESRPDPGVNFICSVARAADLNAPIGKFPIAQKELRDGEAFLKQSSIKI